ncbi:hypothetical protein BJY04DRAFT_205340 [Aspergillus karnatakaensis]|uniref:FAD-dependent oxidoreductase n=1 Tax=Aspergillus karnatakaensis TaxID=1810916 RepID=UPI003CCDCF07
MPPPPFHIVIIGGSIAGLTLAHCLLRSPQSKNITFTILESKSQIAPPLGAGIALLPNGARILDQLSLFNELEAATEPLRETYFWRSNGKLLHGYPIAFVDRKVALGILYHRLKETEEGRRCVVTGKTVVKVQQDGDGIEVQCTDGTRYKGDLVVGADGVRSVVRRQMWEFMESKGLKEELGREREAMSCEYSCLFGISEPTPGLADGSEHRTFGEGWSFMHIVGKQKRVYWFLFKRLDRKYAASEIPRFDQSMVGQFVEPFLDNPASDTVPFREVYKRVITYRLVPLEEAWYDHWAIDRWVCIGDAAHKMTPNLGQGGNCAIESAAALVNSIHNLLQASSDAKISTKEIHSHLQAWQAKQQARVRYNCKDSYNLTRLEALSTLKDRVFSLYLLPYLDKYLPNPVSKLAVGARRIEYLPLPERSLTGTVPFDDTRPVMISPIWKWVRGAAPLVHALGTYSNKAFPPYSLQFRLVHVYALALEQISGICLLETNRNMNL